MKWNLVSIMDELADKMETEALDAIACGSWGRSETMNQLLIVDCLKSGWTLDDFFMEFKDSNVMDPWKIKKDMECLIASKQIEEMFEKYGEENKCL